MTLSHTPSGTLDPGVLVRYLHGELDAAGAEAVDRHFRECSRCRTLAETLEARERELGEKLRRTDAADPGRDVWDAALDEIRKAAAGGRRRGNPSRRLLVAGVVLVFAATAAAASEPVRSWVTGTWSQLRDPDPVPAATGPDAAEGAGRAGVRFQADGPGLDVVVESVQPEGGTLTVTFDGRGPATVSVVGGGSERLAVGERSVRIGNDRSSRAAYLVTVPRAVRRVTVRLVGLPPLDLHRPEEPDIPPTGAAAGGADATVVVDLRDGTVRKGDPDDEH